MKKIIIAIDGHSGCGKSSTAKEVAKILGIKYIDSGATYRAATLYFSRNNIRLDDHEAIVAAVKQIEVDIRFNPKTAKYETWLNGENVENDIRRMEITERVSEVSVISEVREAMTAQQRKMAEGSSVIMDGRDIGTAVFPYADLKIFMTADVNIRANRRVMELIENNIEADFEVVKQNLIKRDRIDSGRALSPLKRAEDAIDINTSYLTFEEQVDQVVKLARTRMETGS
jgi:CMP/dCMP kinase